MSGTNAPRDKALSADGELRQRAEEQLLDAGSEEMGHLNLDQAKGLLHELRVHQIELELQNEELRRAQLALDASRARYFDLYDLAPVAYLTLSEKGLILEANLRAGTMLRSGRAALVMQALPRFIYQADQDVYYLHHKKLFETGEPQACELRLEPLEGEPSWARMEAALATDAVSQERVCRVTLSDINEDRRLKAQLALTDRLSSVGLLAASIAHEINNPLSYVLYDLETMAGELPAVAARLLPPESRAARHEEPADQEDALAATHSALAELGERARSALEGAQRVRDIVKSMRAFSHSCEERIEPLQLNDVLETALTMTAKEISTRARLVTDLDLLPPVAANKGQLCQVLLNLLINAAHAIETGHIDDNAVSVRTWSAGGDVLAAISDTGCGIPEHNLDQIFDPFFTTKPIGSGTGLGLAICMKLVTGAGGTLSVKSKVGAGSTFTLRLPAIATAAALAGDSPPVAPGDAITNDAIASDAIARDAPPRGRILIIDDESLVRRVLLGILKDHETVVADSGISGRDILADDLAFDVILCDLMMPGLSGMDLFSWLQQRDPAAARRVVFITGGAFTPKTREFLAAAHAPTFDKPFDVPRLQAEIAARIKAAQANGSVS